MQKGCFSSQAALLVVSEFIVSLLLEKENTIIFLGRDPATEQRVA